MAEPKKAAAKPRQARQKPQAATAGVARSYSITVEGVTYVAHEDEFDSYLTSRFRREVGGSFMAFMDSLGDEYDIDVIAVIVWVARCQAGERVSFEKVARAIKYDTDVEVSVQTAPPPEV